MTVNARVLSGGGALLAHLVALACLPASAAQAPGHPAPIFDRRPLFGPGVATSDDVHRTVMPSDYNAPSGAFVLVGGRLFDGTGAPARPATILVRGKTIAAILRPGDRTWPPDAKVYQLNGETVLPGLIDLHTHLTYIEPGTEGSSASQAEATLRGLDRMRLFAESGITSVRDLGSHGAAPFALKSWQMSGRILGPRVFPAGQLITARGGHATEGTLATAPDDPNASIREASGADGFRDAVRLQFKQGADIIKLASHYSQAEVDAAVDEAHALGLPVTVDAESEYITRAIDAGVDCIEHPLPRTDADISAMAKRGVASVITIIPYHIIMAQSHGYWGTNSRRFELNDQITIAMFKKLRAAGVKIGVGTDLILDWIKFMPDAYIQELRYFTDVGYSVPEALVAATKTNSEILRMNDKLGTIEVGKLADILVVDGTPDRRLEDLKKVGLVFVNGRLVVRQGRLETMGLSPQALP